MLNRRRLLGATLAGLTGTTALTSMAEAQPSARRQAPWAVVLVVRRHRLHHVPKVRAVANPAGMPHGNPATGLGVAATMPGFPGSGWNDDAAVHGAKAAGLNAEAAGSG
jgi:hypothetical protein